MKKAITGFLTLLIPISIFGQMDIFKIDSLTTEMTSCILTNGKSEFVLIYEFGCVGCYTVEDCGCEFDDIETYIMWLDQESKIKKMDCCRIYPEMKFDGDQILNSIASDMQNIFTNTFKYDYLESHGDFHRLKLVGKEVEKSIHIPNELFNSDYIYLEHNLNQKAKFLIDDLLLVIPKVNDKLTSK